MLFAFSRDKGAPASGWLRHGLASLPDAANAIVGIVGFSFVLTMAAFISVAARQS